MRYPVAYWRLEGRDSAVYGAEAYSHLNADRLRLLSQLTMATRLAGYSVERSALAYAEGGQIFFLGDYGLNQSQDETRRLGVVSS